MSDWISVTDRLPHPAMMVLVATIDHLGNGFVVMAEYSDGKSLLVADECCIEDWGTYDEKTDEWWCPVGWFESNQTDETHWQVNEPVTHWMPLPDPPVEGDE